MSLGEEIGDPGSAETTGQGRAARKRLPVGPGSDPRIEHRHDTPVLVAPDQPSEPLTELEQALGSA